MGVFVCDGDVGVFVCDGDVGVFVCPQEIMAQEEILRKEKELQDARRRLEKIRKEKYKDRPPEEYDSSSSV